MQRGTVPLRAGVHALAQIGSPTALPTVLELFDDPDPTTRKEAIRAAASLLDPAQVDGRAVDPASASLRDAGTPIDEKIELVRLLGRTGAPRAEAVLLPLVSAKPPALRLAVIEALGSLRAPAATTASACKTRPAGVLAAGDGAARGARRRVGRGAPRRVDVARARGRRGGGARAAAAPRGLGGAGPERARDRPLRRPRPQRRSRARGPGARGLRHRAGVGARRADRGPRADARAGRRARARRDRGGLDRRSPQGRRGARGPRGDGGRAAPPRGRRGSGVRANAAWSLGAVGTKPSLAALARLTGDPDVAVAGNAAASLGRIAGRASAGGEVAKALCSALSDARPYVRANALGGLSIAGATCDASTASDLLARDPSESVRLAAADYLARGASRGDKAAEADNARSSAASAKRKTPASPAAALTPLRPRRARPPSTTSPSTWSPTGAAPRGARPLRPGARRRPAPPQARRSPRRDLRNRGAGRRDPPRGPRGAGALRAH